MEPTKAELRAEQAASDRRQDRNALLALYIFASGVVIMALILWATTKS